MSLFTELFGQEQIRSIHELHRNTFGQKETSAEQKFEQSTVIIPLAAKTNSTPKKIVFGYLPDWEYQSGAVQNLRYDLLTHIAAFDFNVSANGMISKPSGWPWTNLINEAHANGVKVIMCAVNFDGDEISGIINNAATRQIFFNNVKSQIEQYSLDGINIDFESLNTSDRSSNINNFMSALTNFIHTELPGKEVSFAAPIWDWSNYWDQTGLANSCDYIFVMGYAFAGSWSDNAGPGAPLTGASVTSPCLRASMETEKNYLPVVESMPEKLILGIPYYGLHWKTQTLSARSTVLDFIESTRFRVAQPMSETYGFQWDQQSQTPWSVWNENNNWHQMWFDNDSSLALKYDLAIEKKLLGVGMWALGYDGTREELWELLDRKFGELAVVPEEPNTIYAEQYDVNKIQLEFQPGENFVANSVLISDDGVDFKTVANTTNDYFRYTFTASDTLKYFKIISYNGAGESEPSELIGTGIAGEKKILVVNGFDREENNTHDFIKQYGDILVANGFSFVSVSNEAVVNQLVDLEAYELVVWILGKESAVDNSLDKIEQSLVKNFLDSGGRLLISGSEIGFDLYENGDADDRSFYQKYLKANYISDSPNNESQTYYQLEPIAGAITDGLPLIEFDNGTNGTYDVNTPDAVVAADGAVNILQYANLDPSLGYAGISFEGKFDENGTDAALVYLTVPIETIYDHSERQQLLSILLNFLSPSVSSILDDNSSPVEFNISQNYPNPFNPSTSIVFSIPAPAQFTILKIYDILGREMATLVNEIKSPGNYELGFDASMLPSGVYFYKLTAGSLTQTKKMILLK